MWEILAPKSIGKYYCHEELLLQLILDRNFYYNVWNFLAFSILNTCLINISHSLFPSGLWAAPVIQENRRKMLKPEHGLTALSQMFLHILIHLSNMKPFTLWRPCSSSSQRTGDYSTKLQRELQHHLTNGGGLPYPGHCFPPLAQCCEHPLLLVKTQFYDLSRRRVCAVWI